MFKQFDFLEVIEPFLIPVGKGRPVKGKIGDIFTVTSPTYNNKDFCLIDRKNKAKLNLGYRVNNADIQRFFKVIN